MALVKVHKKNGIKYSKYTLTTKKVLVRINTEQAIAQNNRLFATKSINIKIGRVKDEKKIS